MATYYWAVTCLFLIPATVYASWIDYTQKRVPNWLNALIICSGFTVQAAFFGWAGLAHGAWGLLMGFGLLIVPWLMHGMGAGDVKLMAAIGVWLGPLMTLYAFLLGGVLGGVIATIMIFWTGRFWYAFANTRTILRKFCSLRMLFSEFGSPQSFGESSQLLPYGVPLTIGSIVVLMGQTLSWWTL